MSEVQLAVVAGSRGSPRAPIDPWAGRFLLASLGYLIVVVGFVFAGAAEFAVGAGGRMDSSGLLEVRDLVALFGWVGLMISGVSLIVVPNHFGTRLEPRWAPRLHWWGANVGLVGLLASGLAGAVMGVPAWTMAPFLALVAASFLGHALVTVRTIRRAVVQLAPGGVSRGADGSSPVGATLTPGSLR